MRFLIEEIQSIKTIFLKAEISRDFSRKQVSDLIKEDLVYSEGSNKRAETVTLHFKIPAQHGPIRYLHGPVSFEARRAEDCKFFLF